jgi:hypothetical protein
MAKVLRIFYLVLMNCWLCALGCLVGLVGCSENSGAIAGQQVSSQAAKAGDPLVCTLGNGRIEIKPRMKYEIAISLHVLKYAEDHHKLLIRWAQQMRKDLSEETLGDATTLIENSHEWQLCSLVQEYDGPDVIEKLVAFINADKEKAITEWASKNGRHVLENLELTPEQFPAWYADFLKRYYDEAFGKQWLSKHRELVYVDARATAKELESLEFSPTTFMEQFTGRKFAGSSKVILYPSSFSRPQHAYGFSEEGHKVTVYKIGGGKMGVLGSIFHELLHPLIRNWWEAERMKQPISELAEQPLFKTEWEQRGKGSYPFPERWLDELIVHSIATYMTHKAGLITEDRARRHSCAGYENALYDAIFDRYDSFENINDFIFYAITHIESVGKGPDAHFSYVKEGK